MKLMHFFIDKGHFSFYIDVNMRATSYVIIH